MATNRIGIPEAQYWTGRTLDGLNVPIGLNSTGEIHFFEIGKGTVHHGLIGGQTGSGKTNLLHVLIMQLALKYPPEELEMYLVDFKEGVEFQDYIALPHARAVALESGREFGLELRSSDYKPAEAAVQLLRIAEDGPEVGIHVIAWVDGSSTLEQTIKRNGDSKGK